MKLTNIQCKNAKYSQDGKGNKLSDGRGLFLHVKENGKYWRMNYRFLGKQKTLYIGVYPETSLLEAREKREAARKLLKDNKDPSIEKKLAKIELRANHDNNFEMIAREWHGQNSHIWNKKHSEITLRRMETHLFPTLGKRPIRDIKEAELLAALQTLEVTGKRDLTHRMLQHCNKIFLYAISTGRAERNIVQNLKGALQPVKHRGLAHLEESQMPDFLKNLEQYDTDYNGNVLTKLAFKFLILTFVRSGEIRGAKWEEIDWEKSQWRIPEERMKMKEIHIVPLSKQSIEILKQLHDITGHNICGFIFPSRNNPRKGMSENTFLRAIDVLGYKGKTTGHGFRSVASTILNEKQFRRDVIERQLAHGERDQVRAAYNFAQYIPERTEMMQWYADHIDELRSKDN